MPLAAPMPRPAGYVNRQGFTLIELSLVLTIVALIIGGIIVGQSLIRTAQVQSAISDIKRFQNALVLFKEKYQYLPGDMPNATTFWGSDSNCPNTSSNAIPKTATCNGDGNGRIADLDCSSGSCGYTGAYEQYRAWQHLADAGFIEGTYTGVTGPLGSANNLAGINTPKPALTGAVYNVQWEADPLGVNNFPATAMHHISFGSSTVNSGAWNPIITSAEALGIDQKLDDGMPGTGSIRAPSSSTSQAPNCATTNVASTAQYKTSVSGNTCMLEFMLGF